MFLTIALGIFLVQRRVIHELCSISTCFGVGRELILSEVVVPWTGLARLVAFLVQIWVALSQGREVGDEDVMKRGVDVRVISVPQVVNVLDKRRRVE